jgi:outer membrane lipoprotein-sorting protein
MKPLLVAAALLGLVITRAFAEPTVPPAIAERLKQLESRLSDVRTLKVNFVQEKEMAILDQKLVIKGRVTLQQPGRLAWRVESPIRYAMVIDGSTLRQWSEDMDGVQQFSLAGNPVFRTAVKQIQSWFSGNYLALTGDFNVAIICDSPLALRFTPRPNSPTREMISRIVMRFGSDERFLVSLEVDEAGGDKMRIAFSKPEINPPLTKAEWNVKSHD